MGSIPNLFSFMGGQNTGFSFHQFLKNLERQLTVVSLTL